MKRSKELPSGGPGGPGSPGEDDGRPTAVSGRGTSQRPLVLLTGRLQIFVQAILQSLCSRTHKVVFLFLMVVYSFFCHCVGRPTKWCFFSYGCVVLLSLCRKTHKVVFFMSGSCSPTSYHCVGGHGCVAPLPQKETWLSLCLPVQIPYRCPEPASRSTLPPVAIPRAHWVARRGSPEPSSSTKRPPEVSHRPYWVEKGGSPEPASSTKRPPEVTHRPHRLSPQV
jgi:hypothetical protein